MNTIEELEKRRNKCPYLIFTGLGLFCVSFILAIVFLISPKTLILIFLLIFLVASIAVFLTGYISFLNVSRDFSDFIIDAVRKDILPGASYFPNKGVPLDDVNKCGLFQISQRSKVRDYLVGKVNDVNFKTSHLILEERRVHTDKTGNRDVSYVPYFNGKIFIFNFEKQFKSNIIVTEANLIDGFYQMKRISFRNDDFGKKYKIFSENEEFTKGFLKEEIIDTFLALDKHNPDSLYFAIKGNKVILAINNIDFNIFKVRLNKKIDQNIVAYLKERVDIITYLLNLINDDDTLFEN